MAHTQQIEAAAEAIRVTMKNMYGVEKLDYDDRCQIARAAIRAAEIAMGATLAKLDDGYAIVYLNQ